MRVPKAIRLTAVFLASVVVVTGMSNTVFAVSIQSPADLERTESIVFQQTTGPSFGDATIDDQEYERGYVIRELILPEATGGSGMLTYTLSPTLPTGLYFNETERKISGAPSSNQLSAKTFFWTVTDDDDATATLTFTIEIYAFVKGRVPSFGDMTIEDQTYYLGRTITDLQLPAVVKRTGNGIINYAIDPALPDGLVFDESTRTISGTPKALGTTQHTFTAKDFEGDAASLNFTILLINPLDTAYISKIGPAVRSVAVSPGETVVLRTHLYGLQGEVDADLDSDAVSFSWSYAAAGSNDSNAISGNDAAVLFTVPASPGTYTAKATLTNDYCASSTPNEWKASDCTAKFEVVVKRPSASAAEDAAPVNPPASAIPSILTDSDGNQYEVFTPEQGGTFAGEGYWVQADPGAVPNGEVIGIRMAAGEAADNSEMTAHRYTLGGSTYEIAAVDADGASVSGYVLEPNGLEVCLPLPDHLRANVSDASVVGHADDSLAILTSTVRIHADGLLVCGTLSHLPATVAAGIEGSPKAAEAADDPTTPATGGAAPASGTPLLLLVLGVLVSVIGVATLLTARRRTAFGIRRGS